VAVDGDMEVRGALLDVPRPDEDEAEVTLRLASVDACRGGLELAQEAVAKRYRVRAVLESPPVLARPGTGRVRGTAPSATTTRS
jgi:hypothetical protein